MRVVRPIAMRVTVLLTIVLAAACSMIVTAGQSSGRLGSGVPKGVLAQIVKSDVTFLGYYNLPAYVDGLQQGDFSTAYGGFAIKKVGNKNRLFIAQARLGCTAGAACNGAPVEFEEPGTFDANGNCTSGAGTCPHTTLASGPTLTKITNWGLNDDGSAYDFFHGLTTKNFAEDLSNTLQTLCDGVSGNQTCSPWFTTITPNGDYLASYSVDYGNQLHYSGAILVTFDNANSGGNRVTTAYGPLVFQTPTGPNGGLVMTGDMAARYFIHMPDGSFGWGSSDNAQTSDVYSPGGPSVMTSASWPTAATSTAYNARITASKTWMRYYTMNGYMNDDGSVPGGQPIWSWRYGFLWPYVFEGAFSQGGNLGIDPAKNGGVGTWSETGRGTGVLMIKTATKQGAIAFIASSSNHLIGTNTTACTDSGRTVAHNWYCSGSAECGNPGPHQYRSPTYDCLSAQIGIVGPVATIQEAQWPIFSWADLEAVSNGTKTDYTVNPTESIWPEIDYGLVLPSDAYTVIYSKHASPGGYDTTTNNFYVLIPRAVVTGCCVQQPAVAVFHVAQ